MQDTLQCPGCAAELRMPSGSDSESMQCPRCRLVFVTNERAATAVTKAAPFLGEGRAATEDHELFEEGKTLIPSRELQGSWSAYATRLLLAASVGALIAPFVFVLFDSVFAAWIMPDFNFKPGNDGRIQDRERRILVDHTSLSLTATIVPAFLVFAYWLSVASQNANGLANEMKFWPVSSVFIPCMALFFGPFFYMALATSGGDNPNMIIALLIFHFVGVVFAYPCLQEIWRASSPNHTSRPYSWVSVPPSGRIRVWAFLCVGTPACVLGAIMHDAWQGGAFIWLWLCAAMLSLAASGVVLSTIIRDITIRQQQRYARLFEDAV